MTDADKQVSNSVHESFMSKCIDLALQAKKRGDSPVGAIIVKAGQIIASGIEGNRTHNDITYHAEIEAVRNATTILKSQDLSDCIMYTTHEPCIMCSYVIRHAKLHTIIMGLLVGDVGGFSSKLPVLLDRTIKKWGNPPLLIHGVLEKECASLSDQIK